MILKYSEIGDFASLLVKNLPPSGIREFFDLAGTMKDVISLGIGEPGFVTPQKIRDVAVRSLAAGHTSYTANAGILDLRRAIATYLADSFDVSYNPETEVVVTVGGSEGIDISLRALCEPGDEILITEPCFVSYKPCTVLAGGVPVIVPTNPEDDFKLTPDLVEKYITPKTKALLISYPNNPTGVIMNREELQALADVCIKHNILVISDEIYAELTYGSKHVSIASLPGMKERTILISGASKAFAMTGWRVGYLCANAELMKSMLKIHQYVLMCAPTVGQEAALAAFTISHNEMAEMIAEYDIRRKMIVKRFREMGLETPEPKGAFYVFPSIKSTGLSSADFCKKLLQENKVATVPGSVFGDCGEGYIRCSYATSSDDINVACDRMEKFLKTL